MAAPGYSGHRFHLECHQGWTGLQRNKSATLPAATASAMRHCHVERQAATDSRFSAQLRGKRAAALVPSRRRCRTSNCHCWLPIWVTARQYRRIITCTSSSHSAPPPANDLLITTVNSSLRCRTRRGGADENTIPQSARRHHPRLLHGSPSPSSWNEPSYHPQLPRQPCAAAPFLSVRREKPVTGLDLTDLDPPGIIAFLSYLEQERKNSVSTRNVRLSAIHAFFHFVASRNPGTSRPGPACSWHPFKRAKQRVIDYLEYEEIDSILKAINRATPRGSRDYALLATMFNTGARVQEVADLRACDLQLTKPFQVRLFGKGRKERYCPLWPQTATVLRSFCKQRDLDMRSEACVFLNHRDQPITRFGIRHILARCLGLACEDAPNLRKKRLHPHSMRHSTAVALLKSGVDLSTISHLLGHASPTTTNRYAKVDLEMKRQAIARVKPVPRRSRTPWSKDRTILDWLESL